MKPASDTRKPYGGNTRALVIALDVGTTFSGVSYAILEPGEVPKIHGVTRFPGQEHVAGNSKIPSIMYYDRRGKMMAAGAEAESASVLSDAEDNGWIKAELFKLRLRPKTMKLQMNGMSLGPLPKHKTAVDLFGDFLAYLFRCTRNFITDTHANGPALWSAVQADMQFVLSHPNGWEGAQQTKMRRAAVYGGLIPDTDEGKARIRFVTEGEASLHACVLNGLAADVLSSPSRHGFLVADAGGGTLDISSYAIRGTVPLVIEEIAPPDCVFSGSVFVSRRARAFLEEKLKTSKYGTPDAVDHITKRFDETTKRLFRDRKDLQFIPFGSPLDKDMAVGIRGGQLKLTGNEVADLFEPSVAAAVASIRAQIEASQGVVKSVWLVGGFAASPWLFSQLQERLAPLGVTVSRPDSQTSKAVADGAIGFYSDHHVSARMSKFMYGVEFLREYDPRDQEHLARRSRLCELPSGPRLLPDAFDCILARSVKVKESTVFSRKYCTELTSLSTLSVFEVEIWCYRGGNSVPQWILRQAEEFSTLCVVRADLSPLSGSAQAKQGRNGKTYWTIVFSVEIHFGLTEFRARIKWVDNGKTRYGPASIVYNESGSRAEDEEADSSPEDEYGAQARSRNVSRGQSPASFAPPPLASKAIEFPRAEPISATPSIGGFERERTSSKGIVPGPSSASLAGDRGRSRRESERSTEPYIPPKPQDKGKERERDRASYASSEQRDRGIKADTASHAPPERERERVASYAPSEREQRERVSSNAPSEREARERVSSYAPSEREAKERASTYAPSERERERVSSYAPSEREARERASTYAPSERERERVSSYAPSERETRERVSSYAPSEREQRASTYAPSERERERSSYAPPERERVQSFATDRSMGHSRTTSTTSRLGETLVDTWGPGKAASPMASPIEPPAPAAPVAKAPIPKIDTSSKGLSSKYESKVNTPREKTRESSRLSVSVPAPEPPAPEPPVIEALPPPADPLQSDIAPPAAIDSWANVPEVGAGDAWGGAPAAPVETPADSFPEESTFAATGKKGKKGKLSASASKAASKAPTPGAMTPKTPMERTRSNDWAALSATAPAPAPAPAPEPVVASPVVATPEFASFENTFQLTDFSRKDTPKTITPSWDMSAPAEEAPRTRTKSIFGSPPKPAAAAPPPPPETNTSSWGFGGFGAKLGGSLKSFGFGGSSGDTGNGAGDNAASNGAGMGNDWGMGGSAFDNKDTSAAAAGGDWFSPSGIEPSATSVPGQHDLSSALGLGHSANLVEAEPSSFSFSNPEPVPEAPAPVTEPVVEEKPPAPLADELGPNGKPLSKVMLRKRQKEREAKEKADQEAKEEAERAEREAQENAEKERAEQEARDKEAEEQRAKDSVAATFDFSGAQDQGDTVTGGGGGGWGAEEDQWSKPMTPKEKRKKEKEAKEQAEREEQARIEQEAMDAAFTTSQNADGNGGGGDDGWGGGGGDWGNTGANTEPEPVAPEPVPEPEVKDDNLGPNGKPLTKIQLRKKKEREAKEAKEREELEELERAMAAEANAGNEQGGGGQAEASGEAAAEPPADEAPVIEAPVADAGAAASFDPLDDPAWAKLTPKERKKKQKEAKERIEREAREKELADFMAEQENELGGGGDAGNANLAADDLVDLVEAPTPVAEEKKDDDDFGGGAKKKKGGKKGKK